MIDNKVNVKEILKEPILDLDSPEHNSLFRENVKEIFLTFKRSEQKSKTIFTVRPRTPNLMDQFANPINQWFWSGPQLTIIRDIRTKIVSKRKKKQAVFPKINFFSN